MIELLYIKLEPFYANYHPAVWKWGVNFVNPIWYVALVASLVERILHTKDLLPASLVLVNA